MNNMDESGEMDELTTTARIKRALGRPAKEDILKGNIIVVMFKLSWPIMITSLLQTAYNIIDAFWIGHLPGDEGIYSIGAMSLAWPFVFVMISVGMGLGIAALALISQHTGAKRYEEAYRDAGQMYFVLIVLSIILAVVGYLLSEWMLMKLTGGGEIVSYGTAYLEIIYLGLPFLITFFAFSFILRAWGDTITPMILMVLSVGLNLVLDPILIFGSGPMPFFDFVIPNIPILDTPIPKMGIRGAAIATVFSRAVGAVVALYLLFTGKVGIKLKLEYMKPNIEKIKKFFKIGMPATLARLADSIGFVILVGLLAALPNHENVLAAYGIGNRLITITFIVFGGLGMAVSTMVGQSLGADLVERADEVTKKGLIIMTLMMSILSFMLYVFRYPLIGFFIPGRTDVIEIGAEFLTVLAIGAPFFAVFSGVSGTLNGSGHTTQQLGLSLARLWALRIPLIIILAFVLGMNSTGAWWGVALSNVVSGILAYGVYRLGYWKEKVIENGPVPLTNKTPIDRNEEQEK